MNVISIIIYALIIFFVWFAIKSESIDIFCPAGCKIYDKSKCGDGKGKFYLDGRGKKSDKVSVLLNKIEHLSETDEKTVLWRRSFIFSILMSILLSLLVLDHIPDGKELLLMVIVLFVICYFGYTFYRQHYYKFVREFIKENIGFIRKRFKFVKESNVVI